MAKPTPVVKKELATPAAPTDAEKKLKEEAEKAKNQLLEEIKQFKVEDQTDEGEEQEKEDPRV